MQSRAPRAEYCTLKRSHPVSCFSTEGGALYINITILFKAPTQPRNVFAKATKHNELKVKWGPPAEPNGNITHYIVRVTRDQYLVNHRDYCTEGKLSLSLSLSQLNTIFVGYSTNKDARRMVTTTPKPIIEPIVNVWTNPNSTTNESSTKKDGKQCCACKNEKIKPLDIEQSINFEDAVINAVFIKR